MKFIFKELIKLDKISKIEIIGFIILIKRLMKIDG